MANAGTVTVDFAAETARFTAELKRVNGSLKSLQNGFNQIASAARIALGILSAGALTSFVKSAGDAADQLGKTSDKLRSSAEGLKTLQIAAVDAGVSVQASNKILLESQKRLGEAAAGSGEAAKFIKILGLNVRDLQSLAPERLFIKYAESINGLSLRSEQFAAASALMGKSATEAFNLIRGGAAAFKEAEAFVNRFGLALSRVEIRQIEQAKDAIEDVQEVSKGAAQRIAVGLAPAVEFFATKLLDAMGNTKDLQAIVEQFSTVAIVAFEILGNAVRSLQAAFFGVAAGAARVLQFLTFGDVSESFAASVDANLAKANDALAKIKGIEQIQQTIIKALEDSRLKAEKFVAEQAARDAAERARGTALGDNSIGLTLEQQFEITNAAAAAAAERQKEIQRDLSNFTIQELTRRAQAVENIRSYEMAAEQRAMDFMVSVRQNAFSSIIGGLQAFAGKSKKIAIALVALNKAMAISKALQDGFVAVQAALAYVPYPANLAAAAQMKALTALNVAGIVASGIGEVQSIRSSGGATLGSPVNPVFTRSSAIDQDFGATSTPAVQVVVTGNVGFDQRIIDQIIDGIREAADGRDVVIFGPESRQAKEITGTA